MTSCHIQWRNKRLHVCSFCQTVVAAKRHTVVDRAHLLQRLLFPSCIVEEWLLVLYSGWSWQFWHNQCNLSHCEILALHHIGHATTHYIESPQGCVVYLVTVVAALTWHNIYKRDLYHIQVIGCRWWFPFKIFQDKMPLRCWTKHWIATTPVSLFVL